MRINLNLINQVKSIYSFLIGVGLLMSHMASAQRTMFISHNNYVAQPSPPVILTTLPKLHYDTNNSSSYSGTGTKLTDLSGNGNDGTIMGSPSFTTLTVGGGVLVFNGNQQYISTNYTPSNTNSISIWFYNTSNYTDINRGIFSTYNSSCGCNGFYMGTWSNSFNLSRDNNVGWGSTVLPSLSSNTWYNVTVTSDPLGSSGSGTIKVYLNGVLQTTITGKTTHADVLNIGRTRFNDNYWKGYIAKTMVYDAVLTGTEVLNNYNSQKTKFGY